MTTHPGLRKLRVEADRYASEGPKFYLGDDELNQRIYNLGMADGIKFAVRELMPYMELDESYGDLMEANLEESSALGIVGWITRVLGVAAAEGSAVAAMAVAKLFDATDGDLRTIRWRNDGN
jgi:hypothetical protein